MTISFAGKAFLILYYCGLLALFSLALHRGFVALRYFRQKKSKDAALPDFSQMPYIPRVTVQLPIFNEPLVAKRLILQAAMLDYPREFLEIQVLDDSTDETQSIAQNTVLQLQSSGIPIEYLHREARRDFKAGALQAGMQSAKGEIFAIFDADFMPTPDFLKRTVPAFFSREKVGMVQTRWGHLNAEYSLLTRLQSILIDSHFVIEHSLQSRSGDFFQFNGSAGLWTRACLEAVGGWQGDSLTEDLDLSLRAHLKGWAFLFLPDVEVPAELPVDIRQLKTQQDRWAQGMVQTAKKLLPTLRTSSLGTVRRCKTFFHLTLKAFYPLLLCFAISLPISLYLRTQLQLEFTYWIDFALMFTSLASLALYYGASQRELYPDWKRRLPHLILSVLMGFGLSLSNSAALLKALFGKSQPFLRTSKFGITNASAPRQLGQSFQNGWSGYFECLLAAYFFLSSVYFLLQGAWPALFGLGIFLAGFSYVGVLSVLPGRDRSSTVPAYDPLIKIAAPLGKATRT